MQISRDELIRFLCNAKKWTYAGDNNKMMSTRPNSKDFIYKQDELKYIDTYLGGNQFIGEEAVWEDNVPIWGMNYTGRVVGEPFDGDFLKDALKHGSPDMPYRGPKFFTRGDYTYKCRVEGNFEWFVGCEKIMYQGVKVYEAMFQGGTIK